MTDLRGDADLQRRQDERELSAFGYAQELFRAIGGFSNFPLSFSIISILTRAGTLFQPGPPMGGPAGKAFGWPPLAGLTMAGAPSLGGRAPAAPAAGGVFHR